MHLLQQNTFEVQCSSQDFGKELHLQLGSLLEQEFYPKLETLFNQYAYDGCTWAIELLELELKPISGKSWKSELVSQSLLAIEEFLKNNKPFVHSIPSEEKMSSNALISQSYQAADLFFSFLKSGILPQNAITNKLEEVVKLIEVNDAFLKQLMDLFTENPPTLLRWIFSIPQTFGQKLGQLGLFFPITTKAFFDALQETKSINKTHSSEIQKFFLLPKEQQEQWVELALWVQLLIERKSASTILIHQFVQFSEQHWDLKINTIVQLFQLVYPTNESQPMVQSKESYLLKLLTEKMGISTIDQPTNQPLSVENNPTNLNSTTNQFEYINNAGLIIFHPFLERLFEQLELCKSGVWKSPSAKHKAVLLSQYLIVGDEEIFENNLILNKILCGMEQDDLVNTKLKITQKEKEKCNSLLNAVKEYWKPMEKSSVEALRETFLQRDGKLDQSNPNAIELWVEEKGYDILLAQLPWGIGTIKTPWMDFYLISNWA